MFTSNPALTSRLADLNAQAQAIQRGGELENAKHQKNMLLWKWLSPVGIFLWILAINQLLNWIG
jgi:hypothetical protein